MDVIAQTCRTPDKIDVRMGTPSVSTLFDIIAPKYVYFSIHLTSCPNVINKIHYKLIPADSSPPIQASSGLIRLNSSSTAKGVGLQILNRFGLNISLGEYFRPTDFEPGTESYELQMIAKYVRLPGVSQSDIVPGTANAEIMFQIEYL